MLSHTQTRTGPSSDPHWDSGDQRRVATAVSQRVRLPCHTIPKAFTKGTTLRQTNTLPPPTHTAPCPPAGTGLLGPELIHHPKSWMKRIMQVSSTASDCQSETCSQEMRESATKALSLTLWTINTDLVLSKIFLQHGINCLLVSLGHTFSQNEFLCSYQTIYLVSLAKGKTPI